MAWVRVEENAIYNTKLMALSHGAFRLWIEGLSYCQRELTNGFISRAALRAFRYCTRERVAELQQPIQAGRNPLWLTDGDGFRVNDYLAYNDDREQVLKARAAAKERLRKWREKRDGNAVSPGVTNAAPRHNTTRHVTPRKSQEGPLDGFDAFYAAYPRHEARSRAERAWKALKPDAALQARMLAALERQKPLWTDPKFIPHPASWLNAKRWEDEPLVPPGGSSGPESSARERYKSSGCPHDPPCNGQYACVQRSLAEGASV